MGKVSEWTDPLTNKSKTLKQKTNAKTHPTPITTQEL